jgi:hypothetical protein
LRNAQDWQSSSSSSFADVCRQSTLEAWALAL